MRYLMKPFTPLTSNVLLKPLKLAHIQTDGSFSRENNNLSRTAVILVKPTGFKHTLSTTYFHHRNSHESEWQSIVDGLEYSIKKDNRAIQLENDNLTIINTIINKKAPSLMYSDYYYHIYDIVKNLEWLEIRWIPRKLNKADNLFRI